MDQRRRPGFGDELHAALTDRAGAAPPAVIAVAARARAIAAGESADPVAEAAVILEPARPHDLAPLVADAHGLTARERTVTELVARGLSTDAIARRLHISPWTVQDHRRAIFEKVGVRRRGELVAVVFFDHDAPALQVPSRDEASASQAGGSAR